MKVSYFPYKPGGNPYQSLFASALEGAGVDVVRVPPRKFFPLRVAASIPSDLIQLDWPHDWYRGNSRFSSALKRLMYLDGLRLLRNRPVVWTAHNLVAHDADDADFEHEMMQRLIDITDGIIVMSDRAEAELRDTFTLPTHTHTHVIPHGHYIDVYENKVSATDARKRLGIDAGRKVALSLGRILPYKGLEELIRDFARLNYANSTLVIAGSCSSPEYAKKLSTIAFAASNENIEIRIEARFIEDIDLQYYFNAADFVTLPFRNILNSGSLMLALSFGKTVVAPNIGSIAEVVPDFAWHRYSVKSDNGLFDALNQAFSSDSSGQVTVEKIKKYVEEQFNWRLVGERAVHLYQSVLNAS